MEEVKHMSKFSGDGAAHARFSTGTHLLNSKPGLMLLGLLARLGACSPRVGGDGDEGRDGAVGHQPWRLVTVTHDQDVVAAAEGVLEDAAGNQIDLGVVAGGLTGGGAIVVPVGKVLHGFKGEEMTWHANPTMNAHYGRLDNDSITLHIETYAGLGGHLVQCPAKRNKGSVLSR